MRIITILRQSTFELNQAFHAGYDKCLTSNLLYDKQVSSCTKSYLFMLVCQCCNSVKVIICLVAVIGATTVLVDLR